MGSKVAFLQKKKEEEKSSTPKPETEIPALAHPNSNLKNPIYITSEFEF